MLEILTPVSNIRVCAGPLSGMLAPECARHQRIAGGLGWNASCFTGNAMQLTSFVSPRVLGVFMTLAIAGCGDENIHPIDPEPTFTTLDLRTGIERPDVSVIGVTIEPDTGRRFVLDVNNGVYELTPSGALVEILHMTDFPVPDVPAIGGFTDIAALGSNRFAMTATNDGFILDLDAHTLTQHFCYLPDDMPVEEVVFQQTHSLAFHSASGTLFAQPQTRRESDGSIVISQVATFDPVTGDDLEWLPVRDLEFLAGALTVEASGALLLGRDNRLWRYDRTSFELTELANLTEFGVERIEGLAIDDNVNTLLVVDGADNTLVEIPRDPAAIQ